MTQRLWNPSKPRLSNHCRRVRVWTRTKYLSERNLRRRERSASCSRSDRSRIRCRSGHPIPDSLCRDLEPIDGVRDDEGHWLYEWKRVPDRDTTRSDFRDSRFHTSLTSRLFTLHDDQQHQWLSYDSIRATDRMGARSPILMCAAIGSHLGDCESRTADLALQRRQFHIA